VAPEAVRLVLIVKAKHSVWLAQPGMEAALRLKLLGSSGSEEMAEMGSGF